MKFKKFIVKLLCGIAETFHLSTQKEKEIAQITNIGTKYTHKFVTERFPTTDEYFSATEKHA